MSNQQTFLNEQEKSTTIPRAALIAFLICWLGGTFAGTVSHLFNLILPAMLQELLQTSDRLQISQWGSYMISAFLFGWMLGGIAGGILSDRLGRVKTMAIAIVFYSFFTALGGLASSPYEVAFLHFLTGMGVGGEMISISIFLSEIWPGKSKAIAIGALITSYQLGVMLSGILGFLASDWRMAFALAGLPLFLAPLALSFLKDPPFKEEKGNLQSHFRTLLEPKLQKSLLIGTLTFGSLLVGYWASSIWVPTWIQDLVQNSGVGKERSFATILHGISAVLGCLVAGPLADFFGRKKTIFLALAGAMVTSFILFGSNTSFNPMIYVEYAILGLFLGMAQAALYIYLPELFPQKACATATGLCLNIGRLFTATGVLTVSLLVQFFGGYSDALIAFSCIYAVSLIAIPFGNETRLKVG